MRQGAVLCHKTFGSRQATQVISHVERDLYMYIRAIKTLPADGLRHSVLASRCSPLFAPNTCTLHMRVTTDGNCRVQAHTRIHTDPVQRRLTFTDT
jgi:hypothetical protein